MRRALHHARRGLGQTTPNPVVGACIVSDDGVVVGQGAHERAGEPHAEVHALEEAGKAAHGATLYCTLEPCVHTGRTGPCTDRIIASGIRRVVVAMEDPFPLVSGRGIAALRAHGIEVHVGLEREAAARLNQPFLTAVREGRPLVMLKAATSADGRIGLPGRRTPITSAAALRHAQYVRATVDAIGIGSETLLVDDPLLTAREVFRALPLTRVIFDRRLRTRPTARIFSTRACGPVVILTSAAAAAAERDRVAALRGAGGIVIAPGHDGLAAALRELPPRGIHSIVIEGGSALHCAIWDAGLADYVQLYVSPVPLGADGLALLPGRAFSPAALFDRKVEPLGPDVLIEGYVHRPH